MNIMKKINQLNFNIMNIKEILSGHLKEVLNINEELYLKRVKTCEKCPLYSEKYGGYCNPKLWINPNTNQISEIEMLGWIKGCGCRIRAKARNKNNHCILNKW